jgi:hypothetical protein
MELPPVPPLLLLLLELDPQPAAAAVTAAIASSGSNLRLHISNDLKIPPFAGNRHQGVEHPHF